MSLNRPILLTTPSFDATMSKTFLFSVASGGEQIVANQLTIRNQEDNIIVYQQKQNTFKFEHIVAGGTLENGKYYNATVSVYDAFGNQSPDSLYIQFRCYTQPTISFTNIPYNNIINNTSFEFEFLYEQIQGEKLDNFTINLYNASQSLISSSSIVYVGDGTPPYKGKYLFSGFEDNTVYFIEIVGATINGAKIQSGMIKINVSYIKPDLFTLLELKNNCDEGYISVTSNIVLIESSDNPDPPKFINNEEVDLTGNGHFVDWNKGYKINGNFLARAWFRKPNLNSNIIQFSNTSGQTITVSYMNGYENVSSPEMQAYIQIYVKSIEGHEYYIYSNYIDILSDTEYYMAYIRRIDNVYECKLLSKKEEVEI